MIVRFEGKVQIDIDEGTCPRCKHQSHPANVGEIIELAAGAIILGLSEDPQAQGIKYMDFDGFALVADEEEEPARIRLYDYDEPRERME